MTYTSQWKRSRFPLFDLFPTMPRSARVHLSQINHRVAIHLSEYEDTELTFTDRIRMAIGSLFEWAVIKLLKLSDPSRYITPGEIIVDSIAGNCDLIDIQNESVIEIKFTWMSTKNQPGVEGRYNKFYKFERQVKSYCHMYGLKRGEVIALYLMGDYSRGPKGGPKCYRYRKEFTQVELLSNWRLMLEYSKGIEPEPGQ